jgi:NitT/TauT family transport system substrate-binding protein
MLAWAKGAAVAAILVAALLVLPAVGRAGDRVTVGLPGPALAEHGGFFQALADGTYARYGLEVVLREAGPEDDHVALLLEGAIDFNVAGSMLGQVEQTLAGLPTVSVAAIFQKEAYALLAHPQVRGIQDLEGDRLLLSADGRRALWPWLARAHGLADGPPDPRGADLATYLADPESVIDGYLVSMPGVIERAGGFRPTVLRLAERPYEHYSSVIQTTWPFLAERRELVQRLVDASILGWYAYLYGDPGPAHALIRSRNGEMTEEHLTEARQVIIAHGLVDSGIAQKVGIGAMVGGRWADLLNLGHRRGFYPSHAKPGLFAGMYTLDFVNQNVGRELKQRLAGG